MIHCGLIRQIVLIPAILISVGGAAYGYFPAKLAPDPVYLPAILDSIVGCRWDSAQNEWVNNQWKLKYEYDREGVLLSEMKYQWDSDDPQWHQENRTLYTHDSLGHLVQAETTRWDEIMADWIGEYNHLHTYDSSGYLIEESREEWDALAEKWFNVDRHEYTHDTAGNLCEEASYSWERDRQVWIKNILRQNTFDSRGNLVEEQAWNGDWDRNIWNISELIRHIYDSTGILTETQFSRWNSTGNEWEISHFIGYTYDVNGNIINEISTSWWEDYDDWVSYKKDTFTYNASGDLTGEFTSYRDRLNEEWEWSRHQQYTYDPSGNLTGEILHSWNDSIGEWIPLGMEWHRGRPRSYFYEYNAYGYQSAHEARDYDAERREWIKYKKNFCYWSFLRDSMLLDQVIQLDENSAGPLKLGSMQKGSGYDRDSMTFYITGGDPDHLFLLDSTSGDLFLDSSSTIDYEKVSAYDLIVQAIPKDSGRVYRDNALITIRVNNLNDNPPEIQDTTFYVDESTDPDQLGTMHIGNLSSSDPDGDLDPLSHTIISGNGLGNFYLNPSSAALYVWYNTVDYEIQDSYTLVIDVSDGLFASQALVTIIVNNMLETAVGYSDRDLELQIYPNPAYEKLTVEFPSVTAKDTRIEVRDAGGRVRIFNPEIDTRASGQIFQLDLSSLEKGVYSITVRYEDTATTKKIVKL